MNSQQESARILPLDRAKDTPAEVFEKASSRRLSHYMGIGSAGVVLEFLDSEPESYKRLAHKLSLAANAVATLAAIEHERTDPDSAESGVLLVALQFLTGFASTLTVEANVTEARQ